MYIFKYIYGEHPNSPFLFRKCLLNWKTFQRWSPEYIAQSMLNNKVKFKIGKRNEIRENIQKYHDIEILETFENFVNWCNGVGKSKFSEFDVSNNWAYCCYEHVENLFELCPGIIDDIDWKFFGLPENLKGRSVFWMGSLGSFTDCHYDTYGCNLVCQLRGTKKWLLFPPEDTKYLYPTRIPYEESSVFSSIDFNNPDLNRFPNLMKATPHVIKLSPGDVLFVPPHWWHFVKTEEDIDETCSLSINLWIDDPTVDNENRILECLIKMVTFSFLDSDFLPSIPKGAIINKEEFLSEDWGSTSISNLNDLLNKNVPYQIHTSINSVFDNFEGEKILPKKWTDVFPNSNINYQLSFGINSIGQLDIINCFTHPDVIKAVKNVLMHRMTSENEDLVENC